MIDVQVTQQHINEQKNASDSQQCAIWGALSERFPGQSINVNQDDVRIGEQVFYVSPNLYGWQIANIYDSKKAQPFTLSLDPVTQSAQIGVELTDDPIDEDPQGGTLPSPDDSGDQRVDASPTGEHGD